MQGMQLAAIKAAFIWFYRCCKYLSSYCWSTKDI